MKKLLILILSLGLAYASPLTANHDIQARSEFCSDQVVTYAHNLFLVKGLNVPKEQVLASLEAPKDKAFMSWYEVNKQLVEAVYANDLPLVRSLNDKAFKACMDANYKYTHKAHDA
jgi:hypothetical protein